MSSSQHPIALTLERRVGGATRLLATVMCLPLVDGIFPALVLAGAVDSALGIVEVGLLIFGGSATVAVILAEMDGTRREQVTAVLGVGIVVVSVAAVEAALAPTISEMLDLAVFSRFAGLVILAVAAKTASARVGEWLPRPAVIVAAGLVASLQPGNVGFAVTTDVDLILRAVAAAGVGVGFALLVALLGPGLRRIVDIDRFRFGSAVALGVLPLSIFGLIPGDAPIALAVLGVTALLAFDPSRASDDEGATSAVTDEPPEDDAPQVTGVDEPEAPLASADGGETRVDEDTDTRRGPYVGDDSERAPWL